MNFNNMIGRKLRSVNLSDDRSRVKFTFQDGFERIFGVEGECCSEAWIEHLEMPADVADVTLLSVVDGCGVDRTDDDALNPGRQHTCLTVYQTVFRTDRGDITLEYRNSSNGYYGGYLVDLSTGSAKGHWSVSDLR